MTKRMLVDATHAEETRVAVVDSNKLIDFEYENKLRKQLKGSIFLAKVTRVEPSLQAAFVNFGGNRHAFLPFSEIHPDYFRIPVADREALMAEQQAAIEAMRAAEEAEELEEERRNAKKSQPETQDSADDAEAEEGAELLEASEMVEDVSEITAADENGESEDAETFCTAEGEECDVCEDHAAENADAEGANGEEGSDENSEENGEGGEDRQDRGRGRGRGRFRGRGRGGRRGRMPMNGSKTELVDRDSEAPTRFNPRKNYKIQEVIKRGQIMLIQVQKEERGNKGAAVTTYLSLPGRYSVLMPNSPRAGGVSRKIASFQERKRMREVLSDLEVPDGMSVILRTAGVSRTKVEIKRDLDYLMRLWDEIRDLTLKSSAPAMVYEEGNLVKRAIRDFYSSEIEEVLVSGEGGFKEAKRIMKMLMPSHVKRVSEYTDAKIPMFHRYQIENQIAQIGEPTVTLKSGGYLVIHPTEALVSIDVNSGRATKERHIEETALKTNLEAAEEVARQLRLRDLGGLIVIDFIDMEDHRNNAKVERRLREALANDRARIQVGRISGFGLMELSRQRLNPSLMEAQYQQCPHCVGIGLIRSPDSAAIMALRALEEEGIKARATQITLRLPSTVAIYILNHKRAMLASVEERYGFKVLIAVDDTLPASKFEIEAVRVVQAVEHDEDGDVIESADDADDSDTHSEKSEKQGEQREGRENGRGRNRRRRGRDRNRDRQNGENGTETVDEAEAAEDNVVEAVEAVETVETTEEAPKAKPRRGRARAEKPAAAEAKLEIVAEATAEIVEVAEEQGEKPKARSRRSAKTAKAAEAAENATKPDNSISAVAVRTEKQFYSRRRSANDTESSAEETPAQQTVGEVVTEADGQKKKGWWNRLVE